MAEKSHFPKYKKNYFWKNTRKFYFLNYKFH